MGKGKGGFIRWTIKLLCNFIFFEILTIQTKILMLILQKNKVYFNSSLTIFKKL